MLTHMTQHIDVLLLQLKEKWRLIHDDTARQHIDILPFETSIVVTAHTSCYGTAAHSHPASLKKPGLHIHMAVSSIVDIACHSESKCSPPHPPY